MTPEQLAELFVEEQCDNTMNIHTCIEILVKNAYKAGYACAVDKTEEWLDENLSTGEDCFGNLTAMSVNLDTPDKFIEQYLKEIEL
jgi:hypothetical protein